MTVAALAEPPPAAAGDLALRPLWRGEDGRPTGFRIAGVKYLKMLSHLQKTLKLLRYLEIGTSTGNSLSVVRGRAVCIDPGFRVERNVWAGKEAMHLYQMTSDGYFAAHDPKAVLGGPVQLAFIDGMHHYEYVLRDFMNVEPHCAPDSVVLLHDCVPWKFSMTRRLARLPDGAFEEIDRAWTGDVWKALPVLKALRPELKISILDCPPTGLVAITGLDPASTVLHERLDAAIAKMDAIPDTEDRFWAWLEGETLVDTARAPLDAAGLKAWLGLTG